MQIFISDLHLSENKPELTSAFFWFIKQLHKECSELYLLGDIFDFWPGDDCAEEYELSIAQALNDVSKLGIKISIQTGNRDFLIRQQWCQLANATLLAEHHKVHDALLVCHGDTLCSEDVGYQRYKFFRDLTISRLIYLRLSKRYRLKVKDKVRRKAKLNNQYVYRAKLDATVLGVKKTCTKFNASSLIHGHTHRFGFHQHSNIKRYVLGDWGRFISYAQMQNNTISLHQIRNPFYKFDQ